MSIATSIVLALSAADIPVVTPSEASIEIVKAVPNLDGFLCCIISKPRFSTFVLSRAKQIKPLPCLAIKFIESALANSAKIHKSPSFSRSSSSTRINILPFLASSITSSIEDKKLGSKSFIIVSQRKYYNYFNSDIN